MQQQAPHLQAVLKIKNGAVHGSVRLVPDTSMMKTGHLPVVLHLTKRPSKPSIAMFASLIQTGIGHHWEPHIRYPIGQWSASATLIYLPMKLALTTRLPRSARSEPTTRPMSTSSLCRRTSSSDLLYCRGAGWRLLPRPGSFFLPAR